MTSYRFSGEKLRAIARERSRSCSWIARAISRRTGKPLCKSSVALWMKGSNEPRLENFFALLDALGVSMTDLAEERG